MLVHCFQSLRTVPLENGISLIANSADRERRRKIVYEAMKVVVWPPPKCGLKQIFVKIKGRVERKCIPLPVSYYCDISEAKKLSTAQLIVAIKRPLIRCMITGQNMISVEMYSERPVRYSKPIRSPSYWSWKEQYKKRRVWKTVPQEEERQRRGDLLIHNLLLKYSSG